MTAICQTFVEDGLDKDKIPDGLDQDAFDILHDIKDGEMKDEDWEELGKGLQALVSPEG